MGQVITGGVGQNPARQALIQAGLPKEVTGFTVNKVCGSGLKTVCLAASSIIAGDNEIVIAGGQENMSLGLHGSYIRAGHKLGSTQMVDLMQYDGLTDVFSNNLMRITAENISKRFNITREMQDAFALRSHQKAREAQAEGRFKDEILPVEVKMQKATLIFDQDEGIRTDIKLEVLAKLRPAFAAQAIYVNQQMNWDINKVNMNGGAIALGHPIGASGARILVTLIHQMQKINAKKGLATLCIGGGMGIAMYIEKVN
jgi:acetyl-CoA C-acetyltransferase